jgi:Na+-transporting methylmalonyl-CoA/oxaloacetate decarboxylase gamma subunit
MKTGRMGTVFIVLSVLAWLTAPGWCQEQTAAQPAPAQSQAPAAQPAIQIEDAVVCQDVVDRAPVGSGEAIPKESEKIYCFTRVVGAQGETSITHNWYYKGALKASVTLAVRSPNWRTWSTKSLKPEYEGEWMVEILSEEGTPLESIIFFVR